MDKLLQHVQQFPKQKILVLGDLVADEYVYCQSSRVSREAPVLILTYQRSIVRPGGGANAIANLSSLGARPVPVGCLGNDETGKHLLDLFESQHIDCRHIQAGHERGTITKRRILAGGTHTVKQQIVRIDREPDCSFTPNERDQLLRSLESAVENADGLLISDYGYGAVEPELASQLIQWANQKKRPVVLDSRHNLLRFSGITAATPNQQEVEESLQLRIEDEDALNQGGQVLLDRLEAEAILVTRGSLGMSLFVPNTRRQDIVAFGTQEVADVTGAGDTVVSTFALALSVGATYMEAAILANYAAGIVVMKHGTATVEPGELEEALRTNQVGSDI